jgi:uncharacterized BrkB/YihY/UPF0761 family membrane protein
VIEAGNQSRYAYTKCYNCYMTEEKQPRRRKARTFLLVVGVLLLVVAFLWTSFMTWLAVSLAWLGTPDDMVLRVLIFWVLPFAPGIMFLVLGLKIRSSENR